MYPGKIRNDSSSAQSMKTSTVHRPGRDILRELSNRPSGIAGDNFGRMPLQNIYLNAEIKKSFPLLRTILPVTVKTDAPVPDPDSLKECIRRFLAEDIGPGDVTTQLTVSEAVRASGQFIAKEHLIVCGIPFVISVFQELDPEIRFEGMTEEGQEVEKGMVLAIVAGAARSILSAERVALNILQRLSGIATTTRAYVNAARQGGSSVVLDTRKTTPGLRIMEKYAVSCGGGHNHRLGLFDAILIKDNHIVASGGLGKALEQAQKAGPIPVQVEVDSLEQLRTALDFGVQAVLLDNMSPETICQAVDIVHSHPSNAKCWLEASGGIQLKNIADYARTGVNGISVGALTHSARAVDIALDFIVDQK